MPDMLGTVTPVSIFHKSESHKLSHEFVASATIKKGSLVKIVAATGKVAAAAAGDASDIIIGYSLHDAAADELITVVTKGFAIVSGVNGTAGAMNAGAVEWAGMYSGSTPHRPSFVISSAVGKTVGYALETSAAQYEDVLVLIRN
jgi:hypothetical protein